MKSSRNRRQLLWSSSVECVERRCCASSPASSPHTAPPGPRLVHVSRVALTFPISTHLGRIIGYLVLALYVGGLLVYSHKIFVENYDKISMR